MAIPIGLMKQHCPSANHIIEAGCYDGTDTEHIAREWPMAKIWGFEPIAKYFEIAKEKCKNIKNISIEQLALAKDSGIKECWESGGRSEASSSILKPKDHMSFHPDVIFRPYQMKTINMDEFCKANGFFPDLIWFDLQGAEYEVLSSSPECLRHVKLISAEVSFIETYEGVLLADEFEKRMSDLGFIAAHKEYFYKDMGDILLKRK